MRRPLAALALLLLGQVIGENQSRVSAQSQASTGQITGSVVDNQGAALNKATVKATNSQTGLSQSAVTGEDGIYRLVLLPTGIYKVEADAAGFSKALVDNVEVTVGRAAEVNLTLGASGVQETVTITASSIQVQTTQSTGDAVLNENAIGGLPINGRRFQDFITLTPSAQVEPSRQQISLVGQRGINSNISIDGVDYNNPFFGGIRGGERSNSAFTIPQESIKEFQVVAAGYSPEFGRSSGGVVNAVTKSGTNDFHGSAFYVHRPKELAGSNAFFDALELNIGRTVTPAPTQQQWGGSFGGPIKKDRVFFFFAYEQQRFRNERQVVFDALNQGTPGPKTQEAIGFYQSLQTGFPQTNDARVFLGRADYEISSRQRFNVRYTHSSNEALNSTTAGTAPSPVTTSALSNNGTEKDNTNSAVGQFTSFFTPTTVNELRMEYSREERPRLANATSPTVSDVVGTFGTVSFLPTTQFDWRLQAADNLTWLRGTHTIKVGGEYNHVYINQLFGFNQFGNFSISGSNVNTVLDILSVGGDIPNRFDSSAVSYSRQIGNLQAAYASNEIAFFAQDSWRVRPNLTVNYGLRWEAQLNPSPVANNDFLVNLVKGFQFPSGHILDPTQIPSDLKQFGPRIGFAWDPFKDSKTVVRGFAGIYNARTPLLLLAGPYNNYRNPPGDLSISLPFTVPSTNPNKTVYQQLKLIGIDLNTFSLGSLPVISAAQVQSVAQALGLSGFNPFSGVSPISMASDYKNPRSYQAGIGIERELDRGLTVGADFNYVATVYLERNRDVNLPLPRIRPTDPAQRPFFGLRSGTARPIPNLGSVQVRESTARSLYRGLTLRAKFQRSWGQFNMFYTVSQSLSSDDNERDAGGPGYENAFNLHPEYGASKLDRRHQFVASPVFFLPHGFDVSSAIRLLSGPPIDASFGSDANEDRGGPDRPYLGPRVPFERNDFRNRAFYNVDLRVQKHFTIRESKRLVFSAELFNLFNFANTQLSGSTATNFCKSPAPLDCGFLAPTNLNFLKVIDSDPASARFGQVLLNNTPGAPFQVQLGARFQF